MKIETHPTKDQSGRSAAKRGASLIRDALRQRGHANIILATGASQSEMLSHLVNEPNIDWKNVTVFHLDEYAGMSITHPASFRKYLKERFVEKLATPPAAFHYINAEGNLEAECRHLSDLIKKHPI